MCDCAKAIRNESQSQFFRALKDHLKNGSMYIYNFDLKDNLILRYVADGLTPQYVAEKNKMKDKNGMITFFLIIEHPLAIEYIRLNP